MKIDKAIELNESLLDGIYDHRDKEMEDALKLGIEALKELQLRRKRLPLMEHSLLLGETS